jgi:hypothetical protein
MIARKFWLFVALAAIAAFALAPKAAFADTKSVYRGGSYWGSVVVEPGQVVEGDINVFMGDATIEGTVDGDVNVVGGNIIMRGGDVEGQHHAIGGEVIDSFAPWAASDNAYGAPPAEHHVWWRIASDVIALVIFLIFPLRSRMALGRLEQHPGSAILAGLCGWVAVLPVAILLLCTFVLIPLIPIEFVLLLVALFVGKAALALLVGRRFYELLRPQATAAPLFALVVGLVLLTAAELVPVLGIFVTIMIMLVGLGAVLLTFVPDWTPPGAGPGMQPPRRVIGGPPMPVG